MAKKKINIAVDQQPNTPPTRLIFLLDRSTSMNRMKEEAVSGYNEYLAGQKEAEGDAKITLIFFDSQYEVVYDQVDIKEAPQIFTQTPGIHNREHKIENGKHGYFPQGMTSLYDYIHLAISSYKETALPNQKTIVTILTDGEDTSSHFHSYNDVNRLINQVQNELRWEVMFLGANMNARAFAQRVGIKLGNVAQFDYTSKGVGDALKTMNVATSYARGDSKARGFVASACAGSDSGDINMASLYSTISKVTEADGSSSINLVDDEKKKK